MGKAIEKDPLGIDQHAAGAKLDAGKVRAGLVMGHFAGAVDQIGEAMKDQEVEPLAVLATDELMAKALLEFGRGSEDLQALTRSAGLMLIYLERELQGGFGKIVSPGFHERRTFGRCFTLWVGNALLKVADVGTYGAGKYTPGGWRHVPNGIERYFDAGWRHVLKMGFESNDGDTHILHVAHVIWNMLATIQLQRK